MKNSLKTFLTRWERGDQQPVPSPMLAGHWRLREKLAAPSQSPLRYIHGQEQLFICVTTAGVAWCCSEASFVISEPHERVLKLVFSHDLFLVSLVPQKLRFSRVDLASLHQGVLLRQEIFTHVSISLPMLRQVDCFRLVTEEAGSIDVWDLASEALLSSVPGKYGVNTWYSNNSLVQLETEGPQAVLKVTQLVSSHTTQVKLPVGCKPIQVQVIGRRLSVVSCGWPVQVFDLDTCSVSSVGAGAPTIVLETESSADALVCCDEGPAYLISRPQTGIELKVKKPVFADSSQVLVIAEEGTCTVIGDDVLDTFSVPHNVTAVGLNEDTLEVYVALADGTILIYD